MPIELLIAAAGAMVGSALQNKRDKKAYNAAEARNEQRRSNYYVNLRNDAERGGFNPLTALRSGGGMGYSSLAGRITQPLMTRSPLAAGIAAGTSAYTSELTRQKQYKHETRMDELNKSLIRAKIQSMKAEMSRNIDYSGYEQGDGIPVKFGLQTFTVPLEIAKRMRIAPNDYVEAGIIQELFGEVSEIFTAFAIEGYKDMYDMTPYGLLGSRDDKLNRNARKTEGLRGDRKRNRGKPSVGLTSRWLESVGSALN